MSHAVYSERCMFFVGGNDYKSNSPAGVMLAGGCTNAWWDSQANIDTVAGKQAAMAKLMGSDGEPIATVSTTAHSLYDIGGTNYVKITDNVGTGFSSAEVGMLVYHPDSTAMFDGETGVFKIREVGGSGAGNTYIVLDTTWQFEGFPAGNDGDTVYVGGAWDEAGDIISTYITASDYTQEVWVNKDLNPTAQWSWSDWAGDDYNNTWLKVFGFHRVPGDITELGGAYFQTAKNMYEDGVHADKLVDVDMSGLGVDLIAPNYAENITMRGFHFNSAPAGIGLFHLATVDWGNIDLEHNAFEYSYRIDALKCRNLIISDSCIIPSLVNSDVLIDMDAASVVLFLNNYVKQNIPTTALNVPAGAIFIGSGNFVELEGANAGILSTTLSLVISLNNTYNGFALENSNGMFRANGVGTMVSLNDLIYLKKAAARVFEVAKLGGSHISKNVCAYSTEGQIQELIYLNVDEATGKIRKHDIDNLLEVDPLLDSEYRSRNKKVLLGGTEVGGQKTTIGAISQEHQFVGRSVKSNPGRLGIIR